MKLPKIKIGTSTKRNYFDLSHDVSSTCDFGFVQPTIVQHVIPNSKLSVKSSSFLRLAPMPCPTFGRVKVVTDNVFVPIKDVQLNLDHLLAGTDYQTPLYHGGVSFSDFITARKLFWTLICHNEIDWVGVSDPTSVFGDGSKNLFNQIFRFSFSTNQDLKNGTSGQWHDLQLDYQSFGLSNTARLNYVRLIESLTGIDNNDSDFFIDYQYDPNVSLDSNQTNFLQYILGLIGKPGLGNFWSENMGYSFLHSFLRPIEVNQFAPRFDDPTITLTDDTKKVCLAYNSMSASFRQMFNTPITSDNADYSFQWCPLSIPTIDFESNNADIVWSQQENTHTDSLIYWRLNIQLTPFGRKLFKIFNACHFNFKYLDYKIELNKIYAYYKAWFDLYNPQRTTNWEDTNCYKLIHSFYDYPSALDRYFYSESSPEVFDFSMQNLFHDFITDLSMCNYYLATDNITVSTRLPNQFVNDGSDSTALNVFGNANQLSPQDDVATAVAPTLNGTGIQTTVQQTGSSSSLFLSSLSIKLLERLYTFTNKESVLASNIADILKTKYGIDVHASRNLGSDGFYCQISDIMGTVNNDATALGEYAGRGIGSGDSKVTFEADNFGYYFQLVTVVPLGGYVQASEYPILERKDYYSPEVDSLGYEPLRMSEVLGRESIINTFGNDKTFGFRPQYFHLKTKNNLNNGGFAFRSQRGSFLPYCLDRLFSEASYNNYQNTRSSSQYGTITYGNYEIAPAVDLKPVEELRSIGLYETFGNYDRIFYDTTGMTDNFILHQVHDVSYYAPMKPVSDSFDTVNSEVNDDVTTVQHS